MTKSTRPMVREHNTETNEIIDREMNDEEFAEFQALQADKLARQAEIESKAIAKAALLDRLGISEEEARLLLS